MLTSEVWSDLGKVWLQLKLTAAIALSLSSVPRLSLPPSFCVSLPFCTQTYEKDLTQKNGIIMLDPDSWRNKCHHVSISLSPKHDFKSPTPPMLMLENQVAARQSCPDTASNRSRSLIEGSHFWKTMELWVWMCVSVGIWAWECICPRRLEQDIRAPGTGVTRLLEALWPWTLFLGKKQNFMQNQW